MQPTPTSAPTYTPQPTPAPSTTPKVSAVRVSTIASSIESSHIRNGALKQARFEAVSAIALDPTGVIYVADGNVVRKIEREMVSTLAGQTAFVRIDKMVIDPNAANNLDKSIPGYNDGRGSEALFSGIGDMVLAPDGNLYLTDQVNQLIRRVTPDGTVTTLAGTPQTKGYQDGAGNIARFNNPWGITVDHSGNLYVADSSNQRIRKVTPEGVVSTVAGRAGGSLLTDGPISVAQFDFPKDVSLDSRGNIYVGDYGSIRKISTDGMVTTLAGNGEIGYQDGKGTEARFEHSAVVYSPNNILYIADAKNNTIRQLTSDGTVTTIAGRKGSCPGSIFATDCTDDGIGTQATFYHPSDLKMDKNGHLYVADMRTHAIRKITFE